MKKHNTVKDQMSPAEKQDSKRLSKIISVKFAQLERKANIIKVIIEYSQLMRVKRKHGHYLREFTLPTQDLINSGLPQTLPIKAKDIITFYKNNPTYDITLHSRWLGSSVPEILYSQRHDKEVDIPLLNLFTTESGLDLLDETDLTILNIDGGFSLIELSNQIMRARSAMSNHLPIWLL